jgi:hypothetical protein
VNVPLLRQVQAAILAKPDAFDMSGWCGSTSCIAGHAAAIAGWLLPKGDPFSVAGWRVDVKPAAEVGRPEVVHVVGFVGPEPFIRVLDLTEAQAERLFHAVSWPREFEDAYDAAPTPAAAARVAVDRIEHFIATDGAE